MTQAARAWGSHGSFDPGPAAARHSPSVGKQYELSGRSRRVRQNQLGFRRARGLSGPHGETYGRLRSQSKLTFGSSAGADEAGAAGGAPAQPAATSAKRPAAAKGA